jgi:acetyltransferase
MQTFEYAGDFCLKGGIHVFIRPIRPDDATMEKEFIERLGPESLYNRFFEYFKEPSTEMIRSFCNIDYETQMALVAEVSFGERPQPRMIIGVGRIIETKNKMAEIAIVVADEYQHLGLGTKLTEMLLAFAREKKFSLVYAAILPDNDKMIRLATRKFGFKIKYVEDRLLMAELPLVNNSSTSVKQDITN